MAIIQMKRFVTARVQRCREAMKHQRLAALIVSDPVNVTYLTGFSGDDSFLVMTAKEKILVTDSRFTLQARQECGRLPLYLRRGPISEAVLEVLEQLNVMPKKRSKRPATIGIEGEHLTVSRYQTLRKKIGSSLSPTTGLVTALRERKDDFEISQLKRAITIAQDAMTVLREVIRPGMSEQSLTARLDYEMTQRGASSAAFPSIAAVGAHAAQPHAVPGKTRLGKHSTILFDWGATYQGYRSDLTRCWATGKISPDFAEAYRQVHDAQLAAINAVKPGAALYDVDAAARKRIVKWPVYGHGTGHGIGLNIHEAPALGPRAVGELEPGMVVTIEPGVYVPGKFGIRIEDDVLVTDKGCRVLSRCPKNLDEIKL